jgi:hypothetical protein
MAAIICFVCSGDLPVRAPDHRPATRAAGTRNHSVGPVDGGVEELCGQR